MKNFKLKSRQTYQSLADSEQTMMAELSALEDKFDAWTSEPTNEEVTHIMKGRVGNKVKAVSTRLYSAGRAGRASSMQPAGELPMTPGRESERS